MAELLDLAGQDVAREVGVTQLRAELDDLYGAAGDEMERDDCGDEHECLCAQDAAAFGHEVVAAQIATAAERRASRTGTIIW
ncbi:hypothetical protein GCM10010193_70800 [Kitasatospora atroaurantiaca]